MDLLLSFSSDLGSPVNHVGLRLGARVPCSFPLVGIYGTSFKPPRHWSATVPYTDFKNQDLNLVYTEHGRSIGPIFFSDTYSKAIVLSYSAKKRCSRSAAAARQLSNLRNLSTARCTLLLGFIPSRRPRAANVTLLSQRRLSAFR